MWGVLPTRSGSMCSNVARSSDTAEMCRPPLCAKALRPTYGWCASGDTLQSSATKRDVSVSLARSASVTQSRPILSLSPGMMAQRSALPQRSP